MYEGGINTPLPAIPAAAKAAAAVLQDEKSRNTVFSIIAGILAAILLPVFLLFSVLVLPLSSMGDMEESELEWLLGLRGQYGLDQYIGNADYLAAEGMDFSGVSFMGGQTVVHYYSQLDARWKDIPYGDGTIGRSGCGPTALAMVVSSLTDQIIDPVQMSAWAFESGYKAYGNGSYHSLIPEGAVHFGLAVEGCTTSQPQKIVDTLASGGLVMAIMGPGSFTTSGHFIVLRGVTAEGGILVADPASRSRSERKWELSLILSEARQGAGAGGPFWCISN